MLLFYNPQKKSQQNLHIFRRYTPLRNFMALVSLPLHKFVRLPRCYY